MSELGHSVFRRLSPFRSLLYSATLSSSHFDQHFLQPPIARRMSSSKSEVSRQKASETTEAGHRALILVVERNPVVQRLEKFFLEQAGYSVEFANDGQTALVRARELLPSILVTEIMVPKLDGLSLCRSLKSDPETQKIVVLMFSNLHAEDRAREAGADAFLYKPLNEQLLIETVQGLIALRQE